MNTFNERVSVDTRNKFPSQADMKSEGPTVFRRRVCENAAAHLSEVVDDRAENARAQPPLTAAETWGAETKTTRTLVGAAGFEPATPAV